MSEIKPEKGKILLIERSNASYDDTYAERHIITGVSWSKWNDIVPDYIDTCCGRYYPTSGADGHFEHGTLGGWEVADPSEDTGEKK